MRKKTTVFILLFILVNITIVFANSAEPPSIIIMTMNAPDDLQVNTTNEEPVKLYRSQRIGETYFTLYSHDLNNKSTCDLEFIAEEKSFIISIDSIYSGYSNIYRLDYKDESLKPGKGFVRMTFIIVLRVLMTLVIEGLVIYAFGYRKKMTWIIFIVVNLITQGALNILLSNVSPFFSYLIVILVFGEIFVFIFEMISMTILIREGRKLHVTMTVFVANLVSLIAGFILIPLFPM